LPFVADPSSSSDSLHSLTHTRCTDVDPSVLLPKKKRGGKKAAERAAKKAAKSVALLAGGKSPSARTGSKRKASGGNKQQGGKKKRKSAKSARARSDSRSITPAVSPQKNMLIAAAFLKNLSQTSSPRAPSSPAAVSAAITAAARNMSARGKAAMSRLSVQSGAKMLRDAEFLISLGVPASGSGGGGQGGVRPTTMVAFSPSGNRQLVRASSFSSNATDTTSPRRIPIRSN
jgi:hypothetical protein